VAVVEGTVGPKRAEAESGSPADNGRGRRNAVTSPPKGARVRLLTQDKTDTPPTGVGNHERAMGVGRNYGQLRTTTAELSAPQGSTMVTSDQWFTLDNRRGPI
jgi:hypothetical protein